MATAANVDYVPAILCGIIGDRAVRLERDGGGEGFIATDFVTRMQLGCPGAGRRLARQGRSRRASGIIAGDVVWMVRAIG